MKNSLTLNVFRIVNLGCVPSQTMTVHILSTWVLVYVDRGLAPKLGLVLSVVPDLLWFIRQERSGIMNELDDQQIDQSSFKWYWNRRLAWGRAMVYFHNAFYNKLMGQYILAQIYVKDLTTNNFLKLYNMVHQETQPNKFE